MRRIVLRLVTVLILAVLGGAIWWALRPQPVPVDLAHVERATLERWIEEDGRARVREIYTIAAPLAGRMERVALQVGDPVRAGETVVARIRPAEPALMDARTRLEAEAAAAAARAALDLAEVTVRRTKAEQAFSGAELDRTDRLVERGVLPAKMRDEAMLATEIAAGAVAAAVAEREVRVRELERAEAHLTDPGERDPNGGGSCCVVVRSPVEGRVLRVIQQSETTVAPGTPLVEIGDPDDLEVAVDLLTSDAVVLPPAAEARVVGWGGEPLTGHLESVEPTATTKVSALGIEEQRVAAVVAIDDPPERYDGLGHGYGATVRLLAWRAEGRTSVPLSALFRLGTDWAAFRERDGVAEAVRLELGRLDDARAEVLAGLEEGDRVVTFPSDRVADGAAIVSRQVEDLQTGTTMVER